MVKLKVLRTDGGLEVLVVVVVAALIQVLLRMGLVEMGLTTLVLVAAVVQVTQHLELILPLVAMEL